MVEDLGQTLFQNAISSLKESLAKYQDATNMVGNQEDQYKFAILHFTHFVELSLKYYITTIHPLLIYCDPFDKRLALPSAAHEVKTISIDQAVQLLKNNGADISREFAEDLKYIKIIRNQIMHSKFTFNPDEVDERLGRLAKSFVELDEKTLDIELESWLSEKEYNVFERLYDNYLARLKKAKCAVAFSKSEAYAGRCPKEFALLNWNCYL